MTTTITTAADAPIINDWLRGSLDPPVLLIANNDDEENHVVIQW